MRQLIIGALLFFSSVINTQSIYFPPLTGTVWEKTDPASLSWCPDRILEMEQFLESRGTKSYLILKDGRIALEKYFGTFTRDSLWYWASAGKTMTALVVGIAQSEGLLSINDSSSDYLGKGWTNLPEAQERAITIKHQLTMTTGLDDNVADKDCTLPSCLTFKAAPGQRWAYHNAPYTLLDKVVETATGKSYNQYFQEKIRNKIGMNGLWVRAGYNNVYVSNARSMARFGLLLLNKGKWGQNPTISDTTWFAKQTSTSQNLNLSYGYLTWLNGKASYMLPETQLVIPGSMVANAPDDMFAALGKNDQKIYIVPSQGLVVVRMGNDGGLPAGANSFDNLFWEKINALKCQSSTKDEVGVTSAIYPNPLPKGRQPAFSSLWASMKKVMLVGTAGEVLFSGSPEEVLHMVSEGTLPSGVYHFKGIDAAFRVHTARWVYLAE
jgi:CubicO group peptidase (beta-lactamase class C family)